MVYENHDPILIRVSPNHDCHSISMLLLLIDVSRHCSIASWFEVLFINIKFKTCLCKACVVQFETYHKYDIPIADYITHQIKWNGYKSLITCNEEMSNGRCNVTCIFSMQSSIVLELFIYLLALGDQYHSCFRNGSHIHRYVWREHMVLD